MPRTETWLYKNGKPIMVWLDVWLTLDQHTGRLKRLTAHSLEELITKLTDYVQSEEFAHDHHRHEYRSDFFPRLQSRGASPLGVARRPTPRRKPGE